MGLRFSSRSVRHAQREEKARHKRSVKYGHRLRQEWSDLPRGVGRTDKHDVATLVAQARSRRTACRFQAPGCMPDIPALADASVAPEGPCCEAHGACENLASVKTGIGIDGGGGFGCLPNIKGFVGAPQGVSGVHSGSRHHHFPWSGP